MLLESDAGYRSGIPIHGLNRNSSSGYVRPPPGNRLGDTPCSAICLEPCSAVCLEPMSLYIAMGGASLHIACSLMFVCLLGFGTGVPCGTPGVRSLVAGSRACALLALRPGVTRDTRVIDCKRRGDQDRERQEPDRCRPRTLTLRSRGGRLSQLAGHQSLASKRRPSASCASSLKGSTRTM